MGVTFEPFYVNPAHAHKAVGRHVNTFAPDVRRAGAVGEFLYIIYSRPFVRRVVRTNYRDGIIQTVTRTV